MKTSFVTANGQTQPLSTGQRLTPYRRDLQWFSGIARLSIATLLLSAAITKIPYGIAGTVAYYTSLFKDSMFPPLLVEAHASMIMFLEFATGLWLLTGYRLGIAWKFTGLLLMSLAIGMVFAGKYDTAADNYVYTLLTGLGLLLSRYDRWVLGVKKAD